MMPSIIISPDGGTTAELERLVGDAGQIFVARTLGRYPEEREFSRVMRAHAPAIVFLNVSDTAQALRVAGEVETHWPGVQIVAAGSGPEPGVLLELMRAGIREFVVVPGSEEEFRGALGRVKQALERTPPSSQSTDMVFAFLPAKPGVGCSTVALNVSVAMADEPETPVLLADFDLSCGTLGFLLGMEEGPSIVDAAEHAGQLDEALWPKLVRSRGKLDLLGSGYRNQGFRIETTQIRYLLEFARRNYRVISVDLSGLMERYSIDLLQESKRICLVTTPEITALRLARAKLDLLRGIELESRVDVIVNRAQKRNVLTRGEIEKMLGLPVAAELSNDYRGVHKAIGEARQVEAGSELGRQVRDLARNLMDRHKPGATTRRFIEFFNIMPGKYSLDGPSARRRSA
jgi:pilus assembly protein CpaE